jgi:dTDP-4-amino-4,6-dideoxygalactose transaminase
MPRVNTIPPFDLSEQYQQIGAEINQAALQVLASGRYIGGDTVAAFEAAFAQAIGTAHCVACNSGTDALYLALRALKIGSGDEVITTPFTFIATAETISQTGAKPVFVDIDPATLNLDLNQLEAAITPHTKALMPVHLFGQPVDMTRLNAIATAHQLPVIEDCAQATGATWADRRVGSLGTIGCFSFYPTKNLGACGDGGALTTHDPAIAAQLRVLRDHGRTDTYYHEELGLNSRLDAVQAAILTAKLPYLDGWNQQRQAVAARYQAGLENIAGLQLPRNIPGGESVWNQYTLQSPQRDALRRQLQAQGINTMIYYPLPLHLQPVYRRLLGGQAGQFPQAEQAALEVMSLPMFPELTVEQQDRVIAALQKAAV